MTAGEDIRPLSRTAAALGWPAGRPSTRDRSRRGPDLIDLLGLVGPDPGAPAGVGLVVFETLCVPRQLRTPAYAAALGEEGGGEGGGSSGEECGEGPGGGSGGEGGWGCGGEGRGEGGSALSTTRFFVHEAALHARVGDAGVLAGQWRSVAEREDAVVRLVPFAAGCAGSLRAPFALPVGARRADLLDRIALDVPSSRAEFRRRAEVYGAEVHGAEVDRAETPRAQA
ncbi:Scr1 family TA system antitoxin-like transcriptional regulator [Saccharothrix xinjiangensis]|uniref:Scr1 family TA system antitoxin-like transcriptional regulator n=1 Tax=Saccharothrix xinjiangensis TaxID=204798 RepID=A0ABV9XU17_9PSEU